MLKLIERLPEASKAHSDELLLPFDERKRGRLKTLTQNGVAAGIFIERGEVLRDGTLLLAETGEVVPVTTARCSNPLTFALSLSHKS